jgi:RNA polymerase sigma-70 factor, ECF subfamily
MKNLSKINDVKLVVLVQEKDQELYREIIKRYQNGLFRYVMYLIRDRHKAEDVVQNTFIKAFVNLKSFNKKKKFSSWIYRIAHNEAMNEIKKYRKEIYLTKESWFKKRLASQENITQDLERKELLQQLKKNLNKIPFQYREILILHFLEEKSYKEISDILRISVSGVGSRINRAKKMLRQEYNKNYEKKQN